eukprot:4749961-Pleurochrysis_carterae.AAC.1
MEVSYLLHTSNRLAPAFRAPSKADPLYDYPQYTRNPSFSRCGHSSRLPSPHSPPTYPLQFLAPPFNFPRPLPMPLPAADCVHLCQTTLILDHSSVFPRTFTVRPRTLPPSPLFCLRAHVLRYWRMACVAFASQQACSLQHQQRQERRLISCAEYTPPHAKLPNPKDRCIICVQGNSAQLHSQSCRASAAPHLNAAWRGKHAWREACLAGSARTGCNTFRREMKAAGRQVFNATTLRLYTRLVVKRVTSARPLWCRGLCYLCDSARVHSACCEYCIGAHHSRSFGYGRANLG